LQRIVKRQQDIGEQHKNNPRASHQEPRPELLPPGRRRLGAMAGRDLVARRFHDIHSPQVDAIHGTPALRIA